MAFTHYHKTEKAKVTTKLGTEGWCTILTTINNPLISSLDRTVNKSMNYENSRDADYQIYNHAHAPTEPTGDGAVVDYVFTGTETIYSKVGSGTIKSFTSETGFFTEDQDLGASATKWTIYYNDKSTGSDLGRLSTRIFEFYKRNTSNVDTFLFRVKVRTGLFYSLFGMSVQVAPSGSVTTSDRLRIYVIGGSELPS